MTTIIEQAASEHGLFSMYVKDKLRLLRPQYDLKYWPSLAQFVEVIADDAADNCDLRTDPVTQAATGSRRKSRADFVRAMLAAFAEACDVYDGWLPQLRLTDKSVAAIVNCSLNFDADDCIDAEFVKGVRARDKRNAL